MSNGADERGRRFQPLRRERLYESLATHISDFIEAQGLTPGDRLPPERELAAELGVSRATLSRALAALETKGRIEVRHGVGALVRDTSLAATTAVALGLEVRERDEVLLAREAILAGLARAAASNGQASLKLALLADDGTPRTFVDTWRCVRRLASSPVLADLDDTLVAASVTPEDTPAMRRHLDELATAILADDPARAALSVTGMLTDTR
ncbi:FadR/GntR family transcriptional regulator [Knoellia remsis]|nr:GntR family transcriptional regulator [Knoellia remsis]